MTINTLNMSTINEYEKYRVTVITDRAPVSVYIAKSDEIAHPMDLRTQYHKTVPWICKRPVTLLQTHEENILPYTVKIDFLRAVTTFSRNFPFFAIRKTLKKPKWNFSSIHGTCMSKIVYTNS